MEQTKGGDRRRVTRDIDIFFITHGFALVFLLWASFVDIRERIIPDGAVLGVLVTGLAAVLFGKNPAFFPTWVGSLAGGLLTFSVFFLLGVASKGGVGGGDVKMATVLGLLFGLPDICWLLLAACLAGLVWGLVRQEKGVPFAPFMAFGFVVSEAVKLLLLT